MRMPVLLYHALFDKDSNRKKYEINVREFERQIKYLSDNGYRSFLVDDFLKTDGSSAAADGKGIVITFDDGSYSDYSMALPVLRKYGFAATFFVTVNWIGTENYVDWSHLGKMSEEGMSIQSHSLTHPFLSGLSREDMYKELYESKKVLESRLNIPVDTISIPGGFFSREVLRMAEEVGYRCVCTSVPGLNKLGSRAKGLLILDRFVITRKTSFQNFKAIVNKEPGYIAACKAQHYVKSAIKRLLGSERYYALWSKYLRKV